MKTMFRFLPIKNNQLIKTYFLFDPYQENKNLLWLKTHILLLF